MKSGLFVRGVAFLAIIAGLSGSASGTRLSLSPYGGVTTLHGRDSTTFFLQKSWGVTVSSSLVGKWDAICGFGTYRLHDDSAGSSFSLSGDEDNHMLTWKASRFTLGIRRWLFGYDNPFNVGLSLTGSVVKWKMYEAVGDTVLQVAGENNTTRRFTADEFAAGAQFELVSRLSPNFGFGVQIGTMNLTGLGTEFDQIIDDSRDTWLTDMSLHLRYSFGAPPGKVSWGRSENWQATSGRVDSGDNEQIQESVDTDSQTLSKPTDKKPSGETSRSRERVHIITDSDGDGVADKHDRCPATPAGVIVNREGCPLDSDGDGVSDGLDDCPTTDRMAGNEVDLFGCEFDSDFDGVPDFRDACPHNPPGAEVDASGCPLDDDKDSVPNGLDDCPHSLLGIDVDKYGCTDLSVLAKPMVLDVSYSPGAFDIDPNTKRRLESLVRILLLAPDIKLEVNGYTDDIGTATANQALSEKRARRVMEFLVLKGVSQSRVKAFGRGEANFVAPNTTAEGRAKNRRIEIVFYK